MSTQTRHRRLTATAIAVAVTTLAFALRLLASRGELWLDEVVTWLMVRDLDSPLQIFEIRNETNHIINSLVFYLFGPHAPTMLYRLPAVMAGVATVTATGFATRPRPGEALLAMALIATSYPMVHYTSEARGYACAMFFAMFAYTLLGTTLSRRSIARDVGVGFALSLALLSQVVSVTILLACMTWAIVRLRSGSLKMLAARSALLFGLPCLVVLWIAWQYLQGMAGVGGPINPWPRVWAATWSLAAGGPVAGLTALLAGGLLVAVMFYGWWHHYRDGEGRCLFFAIAIIAPVLLIVVTGRDEVFPRYFLLSVLFGLLLVARGLADLFQRNLATRTLAVALLIGFLVGNGSHIVRLIEQGRSHYGDALQVIKQKSTGDLPLIAGDQDFRHRMNIEFIQQRTGRALPLRYTPWSEVLEEGPDWVLRHTLRSDFEPPAEMRDDRGNTYRLAADYPYAGLSGWHLMLYRNTRSIER